MGNILKAAVTAIILTGISINSLYTIKNQQRKEATYVRDFLHTAHIWCAFTPFNIMARQSISFKQPNDEWLKIQVDNKEYSSKSELVNDLIRQDLNNT